eukprot:2593502-Pleurochrysis_carterae.AAC.7
MRKPAFYKIKATTQWKPAAQLVALSLSMPMASDARLIFSLDSVFDIWQAAFASLKVQTQDAHAYKRASTAMIDLCPN